MNRFELFVVIKAYLSPITPDTLLREQALHSDCCRHLIHVYIQ